MDDEITRYQDENGRRHYTRGDEDVLSVTTVLDELEEDKTGLRKWQDSNDGIDDNAHHEHGYILGMIAGEGCFSIDVKADSRYAAGACFSPSFSIHMSTREEEMLEKMFGAIGVGRIVKRSDKYIGYAIQGFEKSKHLIDYIEKHKNSMFEKSSKYQSYQVWKEFVCNYSPPQNKSEKREYLEMKESMNPEGNSGHTIDEWMEYTA